MPATTVYAVNQRAYHTPELVRELGLFVDSSMASQAIDACYRQAYKQMMAPDYIPDEWFPLELRDYMQTVGLERWFIDDKNSTLPLFFAKKHLLWSQVPSDLTGFVFSLTRSGL